MSNTELQVSDVRVSRSRIPMKQLVRVVVTSHPILEPDQPRAARCDAGRVYAISSGFDRCRRPGSHPSGRPEEPERPHRDKSNFDKLFASGRQADEIVRRCGRRRGSQAGGSCADVA